MSLLLLWRGCVRNNGTSFVEFILDCIKRKLYEVVGENVIGFKCAPIQKTTCLSDLAII